MEDDLQSVGSDGHEHDKKKKKKGGKKKDEGTAKPSPACRACLRKSCSGPAVFGPRRVWEGRSGAGRASQLLPPPVLSLAILSIGARLTWNPMVESTPGGL